MCSTNKLALPCLALWPWVFCTMKSSSHYAGSPIPAVGSGSLLPSASCRCSGSHSHLCSVTVDVAPVFRLKSGSMERGPLPAHVNNSQCQCWFSSFTSILKTYTWNSTSYCATSLPSPFTTEVKQTFVVNKCNMATQLHKMSLLWLPASQLPLFQCVQALPPLLALDGSKCT